MRGRPTSLVVAGAARVAAVLSASEASPTRMIESRIASADTRRAQRGSLARKRGPTRSATSPETPGISPAISARWKITEPAGARASEGVTGGWGADTGGAQSASSARARTVDASTLVRSRESLRDA